MAAARASSSWPLPEMREWDNAERLQRLSEWIFAGGSAPRRIFDLPEHHIIRSWPDLDDVVRYHALDLRTAGADAVRWQTSGMWLVAWLTESHQVDPSKPVGRLGRGVVHDVFSRCMRSNTTLQRHNVASGSLGNAVVTEETRRAGVGVEMVCVTAVLDDAMCSLAG